MKTNMRKHYQDLKQVGVLEIDESVINNRANMIQELTKTQAEMVNDLKTDLQDNLN